MKKQNPFHKCFFSAKLSAVAEHTQYSQRSLFSITVFSVFLLGCSVLPNTAVDSLASAPTEFTFEQHEVVTGSAKHQTVLTGFLLGGPIAELAVVHIDEDNNRRLRIHAFDNDTWAPRLDTTLRPEVLFVDVANIAGRDRLITYEQGRLNWFDPESETEHTLVTVNSMIPPHNGNIPHVDITCDLNSDDRDDLVIPDFDGDRRSDLLVQDGPKDLHVFRGVPGPNLFAQQPQEVTVTMPAYDGYLWLLDINKDSKQDILMHHTSPIDPHRVTLLISR